MAQAYSGFFTFYAWQSETFSQDSSKRAAALAFINAFSQLGNIAGSYVWPAAWGPSYLNSYLICIALSLVSICMCFAFRTHLKRENQSFEEMENVGQLPEKQFRYTL